MIWTGLSHGAKLRDHSVQGRRLGWRATGEGWSWYKRPVLSPIDRLDEETYFLVLEPLWRFLAVCEEPVPSDVIFVFGSRALEVPRRAADLYAAGFSRRILVSGRFGPMTEGVFRKPEALVFKDELMRYGVPARAIRTEVEAGNTLENVRFGMSVLQAAGERPRSALLVAKAFAMRRCVATFARQYPDVTTRSCPPQGPLVHHRDRSREAFATRLMGELRRLDQYGGAGDIQVEQIPSSVREAARQIGDLLAGSAFDCDEAGDFRTRG